MKKREKLECLYCYGEFEEKDDVCPTCGANIEDMIPREKPDSEINKYDALVHYVFVKGFILFYVTFGLMIFLFISMLFFGEVEDSFFSVVFITSFLMPIVSIPFNAIRYKNEIAEYDRKMKLYRKFVMSEEEEKNKIKEAKEKWNRRVKELEREIECEKQIFDMAAFYKYGDEITRISINYGRELRLYHGYLIVSYNNKIDDEINLNGYVDCELINSKLDDDIYIFLKDPSTQSSADVFFNGRNGKKITIAPLKYCSESEKDKINQFFMKLKREFNK